MGKEYDKPIFIDVKNIDSNDKDSEQRCIDGIRNLSENQTFAVLATHGEGGPFASLVAFAVSGDLKHIVFVTPRNTTKYNNIHMNGNVTLLIDNRSDQPDSINQISALTITGTASEIKNGFAMEKWVSIYLEKHPGLGDFVNASSNTAILVEVENYVYVSKFQEVFVWSPNQRQI